MLELLTAQFGPTEAIRRDIWRKLIWDQDNFVPTEAQAEYLFDLESDPGQIRDPHDPP